MKAPGTDTGILRRKDWTQLSYYVWKSCRKCHDGWSVRRREHGTSRILIDHMTWTQCIELVDLDLFVSRNEEKRRRYEV